MSAAPATCLAGVNTIMMTMVASKCDKARPVYTAIWNKLSSALRPAALAISDTSQSHAEHEAMRNAGFSETHFEIDIVSEAFEGLTPVQRHRLVYRELQDELQHKGLHAVSIKARTPKEL